MYRSRTAHPSRSAHENCARALVCNYLSPFSQFVSVLYTSVQQCKGRLSVLFSGVQQCKGQMASAVYSKYTVV